jgi:hypothetical protein
VDEHDRFQRNARIVSSVFFGFALLVLVVGYAMVAVVVSDNDNVFFGVGEGGPDFADYVQMVLQYSGIVLLPAAVLAGIGAFAVLYADREAVRQLRHEEALDVLEERGSAPPGDD